MQRKQTPGDSTHPRGFIVSNSHGRTLAWRSWGDAWIDTDALTIQWQGQVTTDGDWTRVITTHKATDIQPANNPPTV